MSQHYFGHDGPHRRRRHHDGFPGFGDHGPRGRGRGGHGGPGGPRGRARRGHIRLALISLLAESADNGYGLMKRIEERTGGLWKASPGSVYPTLAQLVDEGLITEEKGDEGRGQFAITPQGTAYLEQHAEHVASVWEDTDEHQQEFQALIEASRNLMGTLKEVGRAGTAQQRDKATEMVNRMRTELYRLLSEEK